MLTKCSYVHCEVIEFLQGPQAHNTQDKHVLVNLCFIYANAAMHSINDKDLCLCIYCVCMSMCVRVHTRMPAPHSQTIDL